MRADLVRYVEARMNRERDEPRRSVGRVVGGYQPLAAEALIWSGVCQVGLWGLAVRWGSAVGPAALLARFGSRQTAARVDDPPGPNIQVAVGGRSAAYLTGWKLTRFPPRRVQKIEPRGARIFGRRKAQEKPRTR